LRKPAKPKGRRLGANAALLSFKARAAKLARELTSNRAALARLTAARHRLEAKKARTDMSDWQIKRRTRTKQLIELGGLVQKAGLIELTDDDRQVQLGAFLAIAAKLQGEEREQALVLWRRRGKRAFAQME
jgi:hypothetical protein